MELLEHFKELSIYPKNAKELKGLILQLAVQGKLTSNWREANPSIEPASELLKHIQSEKEKLIAEKKIKKEKLFPEITENEVFFDLPTTWCWTRLGNYIYNFGQKKPNNQFAYIDVSSIDNKFGLIKENLSILSPSEAPSRARKIVKKGCVLYSTVRPYLLNIAIVNRDFKNETIASTAFAVLNPLLGCSEIYLYHILRSYLFTDYVESCMKGVAYPAINDANLMQGIIPIPPFKEQKAIVEIVNELFREVEQLEDLTKARISLKENFVTSALQRLTEAQNTNQEWRYLQQHFAIFFTEKTNVKKLRETVLELAVQGKLTRIWRERHPELVSGSHHASELLKRIQAEKKQLIKDKKIKKEKSLPPITKDEIPYEIPEGWVWCRLCQTGYTQTGSTPPKKKPSFYGKYIPFIGPADISNQWMKYPEEGLSQEGIVVGRLIPKDSIMMVCIGGSIGKCNITEIDVSCNQQINTLTPIQINPIMLRTICQSQYFQSKVWERSSGSATPIINKSKWENILVPLPPLNEQEEIVKKVNALINLFDDLEAQIDNSKTQIGQLMQSCLREVFKRKSTKEENLSMAAEPISTYKK